MEKNIKQIYPTYKEFKNGKIEIGSFKGNKYYKIGYAIIKNRDEPSIWLGKIEIKEQFRNQGLGKTLMKTIDYLYSQKTAISLGVDISNLDAIRFYKRLGFFIAFTYDDKKGYLMTKKL